VRETDVPLTGAADRGPSQTWETPAVRAVEPPSLASVDVKQDVPGLATRTPVTTSVGVTHRSGCGVNGLTGWLETCSLTPFQACLHFCCCIQSLLHFCSDPLSHCIQHTCFAVARTIIEQSAQSHPTKQNGAAASHTQQKSQKPCKYNFILRKNCSCHSKQHKIQNSNSKISCSQNPNQNPNSKSNSNSKSGISKNQSKFSKFIQFDPNSKPNSKFTEILKFSRNPRNSRKFQEFQNNLQLHHYTSFVVIRCVAVMQIYHMFALLACTFILQVLPRRFTDSDSNRDQPDQLHRGDRYVSDSNSLADLQMAVRCAG
jgi:hypothetical protein